MKCHSQLFVDSPMLEPVRQSFRDKRPLEWTRVHDVPDFAYFHHGIHVQKGIGCTTCHGEVDEMPLMWREHTLHMQWCLDCHRNPEQFVRPRNEVFSVNWDPASLTSDQRKELVKQHVLHPKDDCYTCHR
jgi:hypothetical protein